MSIILQVKRASKDKGLYNGETDSLNWEPSHVIMYDRLCNRFGGHFTREPTRTNQTPEFLEFIDRYSDPEYTEGVTEKPKQREGALLRDFVPEPLPVNTEGVSKDEARQRQEMVNQNALKMPAKPPEPKPAEPKAEDKNESEKSALIAASNADAVKKAEENDATNPTQPDATDAKTEKTENDSGEGAGTGGSESGETSNSDTKLDSDDKGTTTQETSRQAQPQSRPSANASRNNGGTVKVR